MKKIIITVLLLAKTVLSAEKPNIVVILADDLGYGDLRCYNPERGKIPTPHLDKLAAHGMRFTDGHSSSGVCSPSRYALLTGRYHWRTRLQAGIVGTWGAPLIAPDRLTIGKLAQQNGYRTACIGKWHLGEHWAIAKDKQPLLKPVGKSASPTAEQRAVWREVFSQPITEGPITRGFDEYFGTIVPNWPPYAFVENDRTLGIPTEFLPAALMGNNLGSQNGPALKDWKLEAVLPALRDRAVNFISRQAKEKKPFLLYLPLTTPHTPLAVNAEWQGKSGLGERVADLIMETDAAVGRVLAALDETGVAQDTLVLFTSDNGFAAYTGAKNLEAQGHYPSGVLRGYKTEVFEGGHRVPFIIRWPAVVKAGTVCDHLVHQADMIATFADILGVKLPDHAGEDSFSLLPLLKGGEAPVRTHAISCAADGTPSLRDGPWKLTLLPETRLYHLGDDLGESTNLAEKEPQRVVAMKALFEKLVSDGRSTSGAPQKNDVEVIRHPKEAKAPKKKSKSKN
jgi:arylsulfatase A